MIPVAGLDTSGDWRENRFSANRAFDRPTHTMPSRLTLPTLIHGDSGPDDRSVALVAPGRLPMRYAPLRQQIGATGGALRRAGIHRRDTVAVMLPNGPELAAVSIAVASNAICAPLNRAFQMRDPSRGARPGRCWWAATRIALRRGVARRALHRRLGELMPRQDLRARIPSRDTLPTRPSRTTSLLLYQAPPRGPSSG